jgi:hypothetical protein
VKPEIAELWAKALESGDYDQGTGQLVTRVSEHTPPKYCCLGVLCDLADKAGVKSGLDEYKQYGWNFNTSWNFGTNGATLPEVVIEWADMNSPGGEFSNAGDCDYLISHNDDGDSFTEIAAIIREHVGEL